ncbi:uncharacterized protein LOC126365781 [Schistocerca gregaria]|uniref:uncharacterized protein LOC126365781 n=1 Tax=Schistocerca gregaria TaxID=7010 RepID=UPI00211DE2C4|nr:uncharacterized protein LOC126365781 [Schistocerca gregaria]
MSQLWRTGAALVALLAACGGRCQLVPGAGAVLDWEAAARGQPHIARDALGAALRDRLRGAPESVGSLQDILTQAQQPRQQQQQQTQHQSRGRAEAWTQSPTARELGEPRRQRPEPAAPGQDRVAPSTADTVERPYQYQYQYQQQHQQRGGPVNSIQDVLRQVAPLEGAAAGPGGSAGGGDYGYPAMGPLAASPVLAQLPGLFGRQLNAGPFPAQQLAAGAPLMHALDALATMQLLRLGAQGAGLGPAVLGSSLAPAAAPPPDPLMALLVAMAQPFPPVG